MITKKTHTVNIVLKDKGWIFEKIAYRLAELLPNFNFEVKITKYPDPLSDINHWMEYLDLDGDQTIKNTFFITHVDLFSKLNIL